MIPTASLREVGKAFAGAAGEAVGFGLVGAFLGWLAELYDEERRERRRRWENS